MRAAAHDRLAEFPDAFFGEVLADILVGGLGWYVVGDDEVAPPAALARPALFARLPAVATWDLAVPCPISARVLLTRLGYAAPEAPR